MLRTSSAWNVASRSRIDAWPRRLASRGSSSCTRARARAKRQRRSVWFCEAWGPAEKRAFEPWQDQLVFHATGGGFTWETQDRVRDKAMAQAGWEVALGYLADPQFKLVLLDEVNVALRKAYVSVEQVLEGIERRPVNTHVVLTGRNAPDEIIERADLVTEMTLVKHPLKQQHVRAQAGIEF